MTTPTIDTFCNWQYVPEGADRPCCCQKLRAIGAPLSEVYCDRTRANYRKCPTNIRATRTSIATGEAMAKADAARERSRARGNLVPVGGGDDDLYVALGNHPEED